MAAITFITAQVPIGMVKYFYHPPLTNAFRMHWYLQPPIPRRVSNTRP